MSKYDDYDTEEERAEADQTDSYSILGLIAKWFIRLGLIIAVILLLYYILGGHFMDAVLYSIGLIVAFFFGYGFMFLLDRCFEA